MYAEALVGVTKQQRVNTKAGNKPIKRPRIGNSVFLWSQASGSATRNTNRAPTPEIERRFSYFLLWGVNS
jgi:hypothetical protein